MARSPSITAGSIISIHDLCYSVELKRGGPFSGSHTKQILSNVNGMFTPGLNAIMGPTGSGKSSLLDVIADRKSPQGLSGTLLVDGKLQPKNYKCMSGYVVQDDIVTGTLSVKENIAFSANLRLSGAITKEEKKARVEDMIVELGLERCADSKVGTEFIRGVSGGERKRTAIGMELIVSPSVLFLDEPTTGLDASTSNSVITLLHSLSLRGRTIIFSIHQPRYSIYKQFDRLHLLCQGQTIYEGKSSEALDFFSSAGYVIEEHNNPADFYLDVILGDIKSERVDPTNGNDHSTDNKSDDNRPTRNDPIAVEMSTRTKINPEEKSNIGRSLVKLYSDSAWCSRAREDLDPILEEYLKGLQGNNAPVQVVGTYATSFSTQFRVLAKRTISNVIRDPSASVIQIVVLLVLGVLSGLIYLQLGNDAEIGIQNRVGAFFFMSMNQAFINVNAISVFIAERPIFIHENVSGYYRVSSYFLSKLLCDVLPVRIVPLLLYSIVTYFMIGLRAEPENYFVFLLTLFCLSMVAFGIAFCASCVTPVFVVANMMCIMVLIIMMIFGGLLVNVDNLGDWLSWLKWISMFRYCLNALYINELKDTEFCTDTFVNGSSVYMCNTRPGRAYLTRQGIPYETSWDLFENHVALGSMAAILLVLSYVLLRTMKKLK